MASSGIDRRYFCSIFSEVPGYGIRVLYIDCLRRSERIENCTTNPKYEVLTSYLSSTTVVAHFWNDLVSNLCEAVYMLCDFRDLDAFRPVFTLCRGSIFDPCREIFDPFRAGMGISYEYDVFSHSIFCRHPSMTSPPRRWVTDMRLYLLSS